MTEPRGLDSSAESPLLLKSRDAARLLAISERKLWELMNSGGVPCVRLGRAVRYDPRDLVRFIDAQKRRLT